MHSTFLKTLLTTFLLAYISTGCTETPEQDDQASCKSDNDCKGDRLCNAGVCIDHPFKKDAGTTPMLDCTTECTAKLESCQIPSTSCANFCADTNDAEVQCVKDVPCQLFAFTSDPNLLCDGATQMPVDMGHNNPPSDMNDNQGERCASPSPACEGNDRVSCNDSTGTPVIERFTCARGCENGECLGPASSTTIRGAHPANLEVMNFMDGGNITSVLSFTSPVTEDPDGLVGQLDLDEASTVTIDRPELGECDLNRNILLGSGGMTFQLGGSEPIGMRSCLVFLEAVAEDGIQITLDDVPELNSSNTLTVTLISD